MSKIFAAILLIAFLSCKTRTENSILNESIIINDCFIDVVDTISYQYHSFRPAPSDSVVINNDTIAVGVYNKLTVPSYWKKVVAVTLAELSDTLPDKKGYLNLFDKSNKDTTEKEFDVMSITNKGKYRLVSESNIDTRKVPGRIGSVAFSRVYVDQDQQIALFIVKLKDNIRSGIEKLILLKKHNNKWEKKAAIVIDVW